MIAPGENGNSSKLDDELFNPYAESDPTSAKLVIAMRRQSPANRFDALNEVSLLMGNLVKLTTMRKGAIEKGDQALIMALDEQIAVKAKDLIKAKETSAKIVAALDDTWTTEAVRHFAMTLLAQVSLIAPELTEPQLQAIQDFVSDRIQLATATASTYTPDQDLMDMDATIPRM